METLMAINIAKGCGIFIVILVIWAIGFSFVTGSFRKAKEKKRAEITANAGAVFTSPMNCKVLEVKATAGETVKKGQILFVIDSCKMQFEIPSTVDGVIKDVLTQAGSTVEKHEIMVTFY